MGLYNAETMGELEPEVVIAPALEPQLASLRAALDEAKSKSAESSDSVQRAGVAALEAWCAGKAAALERQALQVLQPSLLPNPES